MKGIKALIKGALNSFMNSYFKELSEFLEKAKTPYHAVAQASTRLDAAGFVRLYENHSWNLKDGGLYYVVRGGSSLIAFKNAGGGFMISATHSDSPCFRVKGSVNSGAYVKLETERYGGMINYTWLDRPLTVAGRVTVKTAKGISVKLCDIGDKKLVIPSLAIHLNRGVNDSLKLNPAEDLLPLASLLGGKDIYEYLAESMSVKREDIVSCELFLVDAEAPSAFGLENEFILSPRLDDLSSAYAALKAFILSDSKTSSVFAMFNNEEVGSETKQGAASSFLRDVLRRISGSEESYLERLGSSFMVSADNAHAIHPNRPEMSDRRNAPTLGGGVVVKYNANQKYATDAVSDGVIRRIAEAADVKLQSYFNRADLPGGSTLGSISDTKVSVPTVDIGIPQLAMHSSNESAAISDIADMQKLFEQFFKAELSVVGDFIDIV